MSHLTADQLVDLAEGAGREADVAHVASCEACRRQLADLRAMLTAASAVDVPEPSPLFWDHSSARVRQAVANESAPRTIWWERLRSWPGVIAPASALAAAAVVLAILFHAPGQVPSSPVDSSPAGEAPAAASNSAPALLGDNAAAEEPSLELVADLSDSFGSDLADAALAPDGSAEHAVAHLSMSELEQLQRLLQDALAGKGA